MLRHLRTEEVHTANDAGPEHRYAPEANVQRAGVLERMTQRHWKYFIGYVMIQAIVAFVALNFHEWGWI